MFIRFDMIHERDRHTDGRTDRQTPHDGIGRAYAQHRAAKRNSEIAHMKWNSSFLYVIADSLALLLLFVVVVVTVATEYLKTAWDTE